MLLVNEALNGLVPKHISDLLLRYEPPRPHRSAFCPWIVTKQRDATISLTYLEQTLSSRIFSIFYLNVYYYNCCRGCCCCCYCVAWCLSDFYASCKALWFAFLFKCATQIRRLNYSHRKWNVVSWSFHNSQAHFQHTVCPVLFVPHPQCISFVESRSQKV